MRIPRSLRLVLPLLVLTAPALLPAAPGGAQQPGPSAQAVPPAAPPREVRAIWVTRWDFKTETEVRRAVRWPAALGLNRIFFQIRGRADAFYRSRYEPWGEEIGGVDPGFDPLAVAIDEARKCGVELHAWLNLMPAWKGKDPPRNPNHIYYRHPDWFLEDSRGKLHLKDPAEYTILNPCLPQVRQYLAAIVADVAQRYPVDGIQLDYARFVGKAFSGGADVPYDPRSLALFLRYSQGGTPSTTPDLWDTWRRLAVDTTVYLVQEAVRSVRPGTRISVAAIPDYERARKGLFQDVVKWHSNGWVDEVYPMTYSADEADFAYRADMAVRLGPPGKVFPGIGVHLHSQPWETVRQIDVTRSLGAKGYCLFAFTSIFPSPSHEYRGDTDSRKLRAALRAAILARNGGARPKAGQTVTQLANPPPAGTPRRR